MNIPLVRLRDVEALIGSSGEDNGDVLPQTYVDSPIPEDCFAISPQDISNKLPFYGQGVPVFAKQFETCEPVDQIFLLRFSPEIPHFCRMVRSEQKAGAGEVFRSTRRKSFMTPTPLHIPTSKVSPIPDYTHSFFYLKLYDRENLEVVSTSQSNRLLPLVKILPG
ncbi:MAG: hypothetical protein G3M70_14215 [Candidatus Nitronauta litoralis]|uniref:Uncharacterized protein n=1 Tax=Candidatus Nitronauta litoralis TaxID=2705533 RepID=A0A7T0BXV5_9BACT|nr:MAG: hypothetical protein G3M70_14215 [Candidatus Nitronauta litoralis]